MTSLIFAPDLLAGQTAIVSGAGSGIGREIAIELAGLGANVAICGRKLDPLKETVELCAPDRVAAYVCDIRESDQVDSFVDSVIERFGTIDLLVNNAGGQFLAPAEDITPKGFETVTRLNVQGTWLMTHTVATKSMIPAGNGRVVNITISPQTGLPGMVHSSAARAAVENMARVLSVEWARFGIKLNSLAIGQIETNTLLTKYPPEVVANISESIPAGRMGRPEEVAWMVAYLASPAADFISGSVITIDGARNNWLGLWPPTQIADQSGKPLAEKRKSVQ